MWVFLPDKFLEMRWIGNEIEMIGHRVSACKILLLQNYSNDNNYAFLLFTVPIFLYLTY